MNAADLDRLRAERVAQGLPPTITDAALIAALARIAAPSLTRGGHR